MGSLAAIRQNVEVIPFGSHVLRSHILVVVNWGRNALRIFERFQLLELKSLAGRRQHRLASLCALADVLGFRVLDLHNLWSIWLLLFFIFNLDDLLVLGCCWRDLSLILLGGFRECLIHTRKSTLNILPHDLAKLGLGQILADNVLYTLIFVYVFGALRNWFL